MEPFLQQPPVQDTSLPAHNMPLPVQSMPLPLQGVPQPVMFYHMPRTGCGGGIAESYKHKQSRLLGVIQLFIGVICIIFNGISIGISNSNGISFIGYGIWTGVMFIVSGSLGMAAGNKKSKCLIVSFMVFCIISAAFTSVLLSLSIVGAITADQRPEEYERISCGPANSYTYYKYYYDYNNNGYAPRYSHPPPCYVYKTIIVMEAMMACLAFLEAIFAIWGSVICCKAVCCCSTSRCTNGIVFLPQYCCSNQQVMFSNPEQQPFQQVPYYVYPTSGYDTNFQYTVGPQAVIPADANTMEWNPPPYTPQMALPPYPGPMSVVKDASQC